MSNEKLQPLLTLPEMAGGKVTAMVARITPKGGKSSKHYFREWRKFRKMSQEQVAEELETTKATVSRMETGKTQYNADYLQALADLFKCHPADLLRDPIAPEKSVDRRLRILPPDISELLHDQFDTLIDRELEKRREQ